MHQFVSVLFRRGGAYSYALKHYWRYLNVAGALTSAVLLLIDPGRSYAGALRRCKSCKELYIARRTR